MIAFLWALHLVWEVDKDHLKFRIDKITSVTTDMGTEISFCDVPDILQAFLRNIMDIPIALLEGTVDPSSR